MVQRYKSSILNSVELSEMSTTMMSQPAEKVSKGGVSLKGIMRFHDPVVMKTLNMTTGNNIDDFMQRYNPMTEKYYILTRDVDDSIARELRPSPEELRKLENMIHLPDYTPLSVVDKSLIYRYRYSLMEKKTALTKFLLSCDWEKEKEEREAYSLLRKWAPIDEG